MAKKQAAPVKKGGMGQGMGQGMGNGMGNGMGKGMGNPSMPKGKGK